jgi:hypothetical protein
LIAVFRATNISRLSDDISLSTRILTIKSEKEGIVIAVRDMSIAIDTKTSIRVKPSALNIKFDITSHPLARVDMSIVIAHNINFTIFAISLRLINNV